MTLLNHLFLFKYIICIMSFDVYYVNYFLIIHYFNCFKYFIPIEVSDIIVLPLHVVLHVALCLQRYWLSLHIAGPSQCPQTTSCIRPRNPAGGRQALPERDCAGCREWFLELPAVFPGYFRPGSEVQSFPWISANRNKNLVIKRMIKLF
jgi:hypothetical protein